MTNPNDIDYRAADDASMAFYFVRSRAVPRNKRSGCGPARPARPAKPTVSDLVLTVIADVTAIRSAVRADSKHADDLCALLVDRLENWVAEN